ncbi:MAG: hypothetical protein Q7J79_00175 [Gemmatimonadales bacterium]|nr:hypothetical protein [Gemmatimonadales bacterium]
MRRAVTLGSLLAAALCAAACPDLDIDRPQISGTHPIANPRFGTDIQPILTQSCAMSGACHLGPSSQLDLDLGAGQAYGNLVNVPARLNPNLLRVNPSKPDSSFFIFMMEGDAAKRSGGRQMPLSGTPLPTEVIQTMKNWITNGALNN